MTLIEVWRAVVTRWLLVLGGVVAGVAVAGAVVLLTPATYASSASMYVATRPGTDTTASSAYQGGLLSEQRVKSYLELVTGRSVSQEVVDRYRPGLSAEQLQKEITAAAPADTVLLTATVTDRSPQRAAFLANAVADTFTRQVSAIEQPPDSTAPAAVFAKVVEPAFVADSPVSPRPVTDLGLGALIGLVLGIGLAVVRHTSDTTVRAVEDVGAVIPSPNLGVVPFVRELNKSEPTLADLRPGPHAEAMRLLRTNLDYVDVDDPPRTLMVTSAHESEGKTTTLLNLALTFAERGARVVVVDADLRRPDIARSTGLPGEVGLTTVLSGRLPVRDAVSPTAWGNLNVIPSGPVPPNPAQLVASETMKGVLEDLRGRYDIVLVDAPPILPVADAASISSIVDGLLLVVRHGRTSAAQLRSVVREVELVSGHIVGTVVSMVPVRSRTYEPYRSSYAAVEAATSTQRSPSPKVRHDDRSSDIPGVPATVQMHRRPPFSGRDESQTSNELG